MNLVLRKWNYDTHKYEPLIIPDNWYCTLFSNNMKTKINCPHCGKVITYGDSYTSLEIHNDHGLGYGVCYDCHALEVARKLKSKESERVPDGTKVDS